MNSLFFTVWNIGKCRTRGLLSGNRKRYFFFVKSIFKNKELIVDFFREIIIFLGAYGCYQPGCYDVFDIVACSHSRAHQYYMASIKVCALQHYPKKNSITSINTVLFWIKDALCLADRVCHGDPKFYPDHCTNLTFAAAGHPPR